MHMITGLLESITFIDISTHGEMYRQDVIQTIIFIMNNEIIDYSSHYIMNCFVKILKIV